MPYNKTYVDKHKAFHGWYYDDQQNVFTSSRLLTASLHPNAIAVPDKESCMYQVDDKDEIVTKEAIQTKNRWVYDNDEKLLEKGNIERYPYGRLERDDSAQRLAGGLAILNGCHGYLIEPLCTCFTNEDFNVTVNNNYQQAGGDTAEQIWNSVKPMAPAIKKVMSMTESIENTLQEMTDKESHGEMINWIGEKILNAGHSVVSFLGGKERIKESMLSVEDYLNKSLVLNGARFSYYGGTNIGFNNLGMRFTIFPKWKVINGRPTFIPVTRQVTELLPYCVGMYEEWLQARRLFSTFDMSGIFGWNSPPGGFKMDGSDVDIVQQGTLKLKIGAHYSLLNLVIENATFNFSKIMVKDPSAGYTFHGPESAFGFDDDWANGAVFTSNGDKLAMTKNNADFRDRSKGAMSPLYCEVNLTLRPVTKYSSSSLEKFFTGSYNTADLQIVYDSFNRNLSEGRASMEKKYPTNQPSINKEHAKEYRDQLTTEDLTKQHLERKKEEEEAKKKEAEDAANRGGDTTKDDKQPANDKDTKPSEEEVENPKEDSTPAEDNKTEEGGK